MAVSATVTPGVVLSENEEITISKLNALGTPTVDVSGAVGTLSLAAGSVTNTEIATSAAIQHDKLAALSTGQLIVGNAGTPTAATVSGDVTVAADGAVTIANDAINAAKLADGAVDGAAIAMGSDAQGDILYHNGTSYVRLGAGTDGEFLKTQGAAANPVWASPADADTSGLSFHFDTSNGTFTVPSGVTKVLVQAQGGGSGSYGQYDGGGGGYFEKSLTVTAGEEIDYSVGAAGNNGPSNNHSGVTAGGNTTITMENGEVFTAGGAPVPNYTTGVVSAATNSGLASGDISIAVARNYPSGILGSRGAGGIGVAGTGVTSTITASGGFIKFIY